jgi:hypothetical protein
MHLFPDDHFSNFGEVGDQRGVQLFELGPQDQFDEALRSPDDGAGVSSRLPPKVPIAVWTGATKTTERSEVICIAILLTISVYAPISVHMLLCQGNE